MSRTLPTILSLADVSAFVSTTTDSELARLEMVWKATEAAIRRYCGQDIAQPSDPYVDILPETDWFVPVDPLLTYGNQYGSFATGGGYGNINTGPVADGHLLYLRQGLVRSVTSVYVDTGSSAGTSVDDFPSTTLVDPSTYFLDISDIDPSGLKVSNSGCIVHKFGTWPTRRRTVKVTYVAGFTEAELDGEFSDLRLAVIEEVSNRYDRFTNLGDAPVKSERLGDWEITYSQPSDVITGLGEKLRDYLQPFVKYRMP